MRGIIAIGLVLLVVHTAMAEHTCCNSCCDCTAKINNANYGDVVVLAGDILEHHGTCITFDDADNITFDGGGYTIRGSGNYGTGKGIMVWHDSDNNTIKNCVINNFSSGIYMWNTDGNHIDNIRSHDNHRYGLCLWCSTNNTIENSIIEENEQSDLGFGAYDIDECDNTLINVTGSGGYPIGYYNQSVDIRNKTFAGLVLANANDSTLENITVTGSLEHKNNRLVVYHSNNITFDNTYSSMNGWGISMFYSSSVDINNAVCDNTSQTGIYLTSCDNCSINGSTSSYNDQCGIYLIDSPNTTVSGCALEKNGFSGIILDRSENCTIHTTRFISNVVTGAMVRSPNSLFYNNHFENNVMIGSDTANTQWNTTNTTGTNIVGGSFIGGNFWNVYSGNDSDGDGFGDTPHQVVYNHDSMDYLPLVYPIIIRICGDVDDNGYVSSNDVVETYLRSVDPEYPLALEWAADADGNGYVSANDVVEIYKKSVDPSYSLNCTE